MIHSAYHTRKEIHSIEIKDFNSVGDFEIEKVFIDHMKFDVGNFYHLSGDLSTHFLMKSLSCLNENVSGFYLLNNENILGMSFEEFLPYRLNMGYSFNEGGLLSNKTIKENLVLPLQFHSIEANESLKRVDEIIEFFEIAKFKDHRPAMIPQPIRKLTSIIRALLISPQILFLEDPASGLRQEVVKKIKYLIRHYKKQNPKLTVFLLDENKSIWLDFSPENLYFSQGSFKEHRPRRAV